MRTELLATIVSTSRIGPTTSKCTNCSFRHGQRRVALCRSAWWSTMRMYVWYPTPASAANLRAFSMSLLGRRMHMGERSERSGKGFPFPTTIAVPAFICRLNSSWISRMCASCQAASSASDEKTGITNFLLAIAFANFLKVFLSPLPVRVPRRDRTDFSAAMGKNQHQNAQPVCCA
jgi:hypothetical protein